MTVTQHLIAPSKALQFITAGHAEFTVQGMNHYTFKVVHQNKKGSSLHVYYRKVGDHLIGFFNRNSLTGQWWYKHNPHSEISERDTAVLCIEYTIKHLQSGKFDNRAQIMHLGACGKCGRALTDPVSIEAGIGPECRKQLGL
jgi:hypothetical protein